MSVLCEDMVSEEGREMKYSHDYSKLKNETYTTIRRHPKGKIGTITNENYPSGSHLAIIENIKRMTIDEMSISMIQQDGDVKTREEFLDLLNSFYRKPIKRNEKLYIYFLRKKNNEN